MDIAERLLAIEEIKQLKARYFRLMDQKDWAELADVFAEDAVCDYRGALRDPSDGPAPPDDPYEIDVVGREAIIRFIQAGLTGVRSVHHGHMPEIEIVSADEARGIFAMYDGLNFRQGPLSALDGYGHYYDGFRRVDGRWRIATLRLVRLRVDSVAA